MTVLTVPILVVVPHKPRPRLILLLGGDWVEPMADKGESQINSVHGQMVLIFRLVLLGVFDQEPLEKKRVGL